MSALRRISKALAGRLGVRVSRGPANRFQAMEDALALLAASGYRPRRVVDVGAHTGDWTRLVHRFFPAASFLLVEPQPACRAALGALADDLPRAEVAAVAVTAPGVERVRLAGRAGSTGAWVARDDERTGDEIEVPATTLDALLAERIAPGDRTLVKLDVEHHEGEALAGAAAVLERLEVLIVETQFFELDGNRRPTFADLLGTLRQRGFELYDFAALTPRSHDRRLAMGDAVFVRRSSPLLADARWADWDRQR